MLVKIFCGLILSVLILLTPMTGSAEEIQDRENQAPRWGIFVGLFTRHVNPSGNTNESTKMLGVYRVSSTEMERTGFSSKWRRGVSTPHRRAVLIEGYRTSSLVTDTQKVVSDILVGIAVRARKSTINRLNASANRDNGYFDGISVPRTHA